MLRTPMLWLIACLLLSGCGARASSPEPEDHAAKPGSAGGASVETSPDKGPAHALPLPAPGEQDWRYVDDDDQWRYVAPEDAGRIYDATFFDGRFFVLHGKAENNLKVRLSEVNWLSWTRDGLSWDTITLTNQPYESYGSLASDRESLLLIGSRHVGKLVGDSVVRIDALEQNAHARVLLPFPDGWVVARQDDIQWLDRSGALETVLMQPLAQFRAGVARPVGERSLVTGGFGAFSSMDGKRWTPAVAPCESCGVVGMTYGNRRYLAADLQTFFVSDDGTSWTEIAWEPARTVPLPHMHRIARVDFTGGHFVALFEDGNTRLSLDGEHWSDELKIPLDEIGPVACDGRCFVAGGRILRAPAVVAD